MTEPIGPSTGNASGPNRALLVVLIVTIVTVGCVLVAAIFVFRPTNDVIATTPGGGATRAAGAPVRLEPISSTTDPFAPPGQVGQDKAVTPVKTDGPTMVEGGRVGLYGGTMNSSQCDKKQLSTFLQQNPDKGAAWAGVIGIAPGDIPAYVAGLTPVLLRSDTSVTNHGFVNGKATSLQSVLQAGTAVLVDEKGAPVTKCYCGNPLQPPTPITPVGPSTTTTTYNNTTTTYNNTTTTYYDTTTTYGYYPPTYDGTPWPDWNPKSITIIKVDVAVINVFVLVDSDTGQTFNRPRGSDGSEDTPANVSAPASTTTTSRAPSPGNPTPTATTTTTTPYQPDEPCVDEHNRIVPCGQHPTTTVYQTTTTAYVLPKEPCVDENNHIVPC